MNFGICATIGGIIIFCLFLRYVINFLESKRFEKDFIAKETEADNGEMLLLIRALEEARERKEEKRSKEIKS